MGGTRGHGKSAVQCEEVREPAQSGCVIDEIPMPSWKSGEIRLHFEDRGQGEPLLLIHGLGSSSRDWENQMPVFAERHRVIVPDLRGHGQSDRPPGPYSVPLFSADIVALIESLEIAPVHLIGLSLGGFVAFQLAVEHSHLVRSLIVVNAAPGLPRSRLGDRLRVTWGLFLRRSIVRLFGMRALAHLLSKKLFPGPSQDGLRRRFIERWAENHPRAYLASLAAVSGWNVEDRLGAITCPTCVISGDQDFIPLTLKEGYSGQLANGELKVINGSGHFTPLDAPEQFNEAVLSFLKSA
jgi:3-oxoadipate enol-lactonase